MSANSSQPRNRQRRRRNWGSYQTPGFIVRYMLDGCLSEALEEAGREQRTPLRIVDPACGEGAFILEAFDYLYRWYCHSPQKEPAGEQSRAAQTAADLQLEPHQRLQIVRAHLFGVDIDPEAVARLRLELFDRVSPEETWAKVARDVIHSNIRVGEALTGRDFESATELPLDCRRDFEPLNWHEAFPLVAADGGFDVVVGNPPYRRELNAKSQLDLIADSPLGRKWRQARMDLWYYFLHRSLDLLRPEGRVSFIVNSYWTASAGARKLIARLEKEATIEEMVLLGDAPVFPEVSGRHLIFRLRLGRRPQDCRVIDLSHSSADVAQILPRLRRPPIWCRHSEQQSLEAGASLTESYTISRRNLFQDGQLSLGRSQPWFDSLRDLGTLGELYEVRQGMAENPPSISESMAREFADRYCVGEGVFVLTAEEVQSLGLSSVELAFLRPYYRTSTVRRYHLPEKPTLFVLYLTSKTAPSLADCPRLRKHLERFRPILERRRETRNGSRSWWQLHWPREERIFTEPRILSGQMGREPRFVWAERPTFVGFSLNVILARSPQDGCSLTALSGILNAAPARRWFSQYAKRRGVNFEINGRLLRLFPLPPRDTAVERQISQLVAHRQTQEYAGANNGRPELIDYLEQKIDRLVCRLYGIGPGEV